ncbi:dihydroorotate dehydrogenase-like protein [bacterium]|nr:dihydroorotate dehydrogenase-like protein [bacterium]
MPNLTTSYMGLTLKSPIIAASSGLTNNIKDIIELEKHGAGAVVLKSLFEEEIILEMERKVGEMHSENHLYPETMDLYENYDVEDTLSTYLKLISDCKKETSIPIIASINCITAHNWPYFARTLQNTGADAIELNIFILPSDPNPTSLENENKYFDIIKAVQKQISIPLSVKISSYFSNLAGMIQKISDTGVSAITLFNRFYSPDIDIENFEIVPSNVFSCPQEYIMPLRWISIMSDRVKCDLSASTGVHDGETLIKMLLAGANTIQVASTLYKNGFAQLNLMNEELNKWMTRKNYETLDEVCGQFRQSKTTNPAGFLRAQFMKHFSEK